MLPPPPDPDLLRLLSTPRPAGSAAEARVYAGLLAWLERRGIAYREHIFRLFPWFWQSIGVWLILSRTLLVWAVWTDRGWIALLLALIGLLGGMVDVTTNFPLVSWIGAKTGRNLLIQLGPPDFRQEILLSAHYDTKTELLDHRRRMFFVRALPAGIVFTILLGLIGPLQNTASPGLEIALRGGGRLLGASVLFLAWGLGLNLSLGRLSPKPSRGSVDNGAACAILLRLAEQYHRRLGALTQTRLTLALFGGEEVNMQGSQAYVRSLAPEAPLLALNLEVMAQDGEYVIWERDGTSLKLWPSSPAVIDAVAGAVEAETGQAPLRVGPLNSDGGSFNRAGIPAATLGTYDRKLRDRGFHSPLDSPGRLAPERIPEAARILTGFIERFDRGEIPFPVE